MSYCWEHVDEYISYRVSLGLSATPIKWYLIDFSNYLKQEYHNEELITKVMTNKWCIQRNTEKNCSFRARMSALRQFTIYLYSMELCDFILNTDFLPKNIRYTPYIFTDKELVDIFNYAISQSENDESSLKKLIISVIYRLIYFCGLRPNEGREIKLEDIDLIDGTIHVKKNKTNKERIIPMADDVLIMIKDYLVKLNKLYKQPVYLFPSPSGNCYKSKWLRTEFLNLWNSTKGESNKARVRVYDLRHRWATTVMTKFLNEEEDLFNIIPYMSAYMGHSNFEETAYYIHLLPENLLKSKSVNWDKMSSIIPRVE